MKELPNGWAETTLGEIASLRGEKVSPALVPDAPFIGLENIEPNTSKILKVGKGSDVKSSVAKFGKGDVLYSRLRPYLNKVTLAEFDGIASAEILVLQPTDATEGEFVRRRIMTPEFLDFAAMLDKGDRPRVNYREISEFTISLPPLPEQKRIVAKVDGLTARTARARTDLGRIPTLIARHKQRIIAMALSGGLTVDWRQPLGSDDWLKQGLRQLAERRATYEKSKRGSRLRAAPPLETGGAADLPNSWISCCVADVADLRVGYAFKSQWFSSTGARLVRGANVAPGRIDWFDERRLSPEHVSSYADYRLETGDVVIAMDRPLISTGLKIAIVQEEDAGSLLVQRVANPRPTAWLHPLFMFYVFNGQGFISQIESHATGSDLPHISGNDILTTRVPLPPIDEQVEIVRRIQSAFNWLDRMAADHGAASKLLPKLDAAILAKAFRGELVPQDPNDEPASVLLERIQAERATAPKKTRGQRSVAVSEVVEIQLPPVQVNVSVGPVTIIETRGGQAMTKSRQDDDVMGQPYLAGLLKKGSVGTAQDLFKASDLPVADFYKQLAWEIEHKHIRDDDEKLEAL
ncbi:restriction endonuclease subunit S [Sulfitobacter sp. AS59]|uniref:restriction endonuclease subunit S n=1 Tax=Sulfitobacter sp. AS59 TaxID=3135784 RepID=UPI00316F669B